ncbi:MAG: O-acetyl-ADP-ribose deacetylase [Arenicella sp.]
MSAKVNTIQADITQLPVDAVVNAANQAMCGGGGVDGAIHRAAGKGLLEECRTMGGCKTGHAKITSAYQLPAKYIIHAVGPVWYGGHKGEAELLASCYRESMNLAADNGIRSIAFPAISCGAYRFPLNQACEIAVKTVLNSLQKHQGITEVIFACVDKKIEQQLIKQLMLK